MSGDCLYTLYLIRCTLYFVLCTAHTMTKEIFVVFLTFTRQMPNSNLRTTVYYHDRGLWRFSWQRSVILTPKQATKLTLTSIQIHPCYFLSSYSLWLPEGGSSLSYKWNLRNVFTIYSEKCQGKGKLDIILPNIQGVSGGIVNILGGGSMDYSE